jgi:uncharacterized iron-regulated membrane protein
MTPPRQSRDRTWIFVVIVVAALGILMFFVGPNIAGG